MAPRTRAAAAVSPPQFTRPIPSRAAAE